MSRAARTGVSTESSATQREDALHRLARLHGIQTMFYDVVGKRQAASETALRHVLASLGAPLDDGLADATHARKRALFSQTLDPVIVAWGGRGAAIVRLPEHRWPSTVRLTIATHIDPVDGAGSSSETTVHEVAAELCPILKSREFDGSRLLSRVVELPTLPLGYHELAFELDGERHLSLVLSAPEQAYAADHRQPQWGVFAPLYAIRTTRSWGAGDLADLATLMDWVDRFGGDMVATLPLLPPQSENSDDPSPYSAGSRLMWNDLYIDLDAAGAADRCPATIRTTLNSRPAVDYDAIRPLRREALQTLADRHFASRRPDEAIAAAGIPDLDRYARFQAACEQTEKTWFEWPRRDLPAIADDDPAYRRHLYAQIEVRRQLADTVAKADSLGQTWYLDYPLGVNAAGYDVWANRDQFALGASGGAPPDAFFTKGQCWGFPPMHPDAMRTGRYAYFLKTVRHHLRYAKLLRFDHVMGLYRLFWIPNGYDARDGAYVRYAVDELFAVLCIESVRAEAELVGENLGTVPPAIDELMPKHNVWGMYVTQFSLDPEGVPPVGEPPSHDIASVNTHDMPTFAAFRTAHDVADRVDLGLMDESEAVAETAHRRETVAALRGYLAGRDLFADSDGETDDDLYAAVLRHLGRSRSPVVLAALDDLVDELTPQNTPGTFKERPNWSRKVAKPIEELADDPVVQRRLAVLASARRDSDDGGSPGQSAASGT